MDIRLSFSVAHLHLCRTDITMPPVQYGSHITRRAESEAEEMGWSHRPCTHCLCVTMSNKRRLPVAMKTYGQHGIK